uniref:Reverse transcriptase Ty1/copia-type domain-containing protein n=1 Tax=Solanum lycopersicum TaxID=4081 RepID=A0A3Q7G7C6_SOLLC
MAVFSSTNGADTPFADITHFRSLIGALQYLAITRPDIQFAVNRVVQRMHQPSEHDYHCLKRILRYIFGTLGHGLLIRPGDLELRGLSYSDWANDKNDRKSTSGLLICLGPNLISWCTKKQPKVSRSSTEAEYHSLALLAAETISISLLNIISLFTSLMWFTEGILQFLDDNKFPLTTVLTELDAARVYTNKNKLQITFIFADIKEKNLANPYLSMVGLEKSKDSVLRRPSLFLENTKSWVVFPARQTGAFHEIVVREDCF